MRKLVSLVIVASIFMIGCSPKLIRDPQGVKGHTDKVLFRETRGGEGMANGGYLGEGYIVEIPIENQSHSSFKSWEWTNKLPYGWTNKWTHDKTAVDAIQKYDTLFCSTSNEKVRCGCTSKGCQIGISGKYGFEEALYGVSVRDLATDIYVRYQYEFSEDYLKAMGITISRSLSPSQLHFSCKMRGCLITDENGKIVNKIMINAGITIDEQKLTAFKQTRERQRREEEQKQRRAWNAKVKRAYSAQTHQCLVLVDFMNRAAREYISGTEDAVRNATNSFNELGCMDRVAEYYEVQMQAGVATYQ